MRATYIGTATLLLEIGPLRLLTDPALDPPGGRYSFGFGTGSKKMLGPALDASALGHIDAVLLTHDQHADNLDTAGRAMLPQAGRVITTRSGARRLGGNALGLAVWETTSLPLPSGSLHITATPARHGPPLSRPIVGEVIGFLLEWEGQKHGAVYISGDTVWFSGVQEVAHRHKVGTAFLHLGGVAFRISGPLRYTFNGPEAVLAARALKPHTIIPVHYDGWSHFREPLSTSLQAFTEAGLADQVLSLTPGEPHEIET